MTRSHRNSWKIVLDILRSGLVSGNAGIYFVVAYILLRTLGLD